MFDVKNLTDEIKLLGRVVIVSSVVVFVVSITAAAAYLNCKFKKH